jgi:hypothetical protein
MQCDIEGRETNQISAQEEKRKIINMPREEASQA